MIIASSIGIAAHLDVFNEAIKAFASYIAFAFAVYHRTIDCMVDQRQILSGQRQDTQSCSSRS